MGEYVNSKQARFDKSHVSCGVMEVHHLPDQSASRTLFSIANALYHKANPRPAAFVLFSDVTDTAETRGGLLARYIADNKAFGGHFQASDGAINPKTGNTIKVWLWNINHEVFRKYYVEELANRIEE